MVSSKNEIDAELINDFFVDFNEAYDTIVNTLVRLESAPTDPQLINALFRSIHTIKGNLRMVGLPRVSDIIHVLETTFDDIRKGRMAYDSSLSDVFLLSMDKIKKAAECSFAQQPLDFSIDEVEVAIARINDATDSTRKKFIQDAILYLDPTVKVNKASTEVAQGKITTAYKDQDLKYFRALAAVLEERSTYWSGRTDRSLDIALAMNEMAGNVVDPDQLAAAVYLHDLGMTFFPLGLILKQDDLTKEEREIVQQHTIDAYLLLRRISENHEWDHAADIVLQHHEWFDGNGYPKKLSGDKILPGAKILSIVDAYESMTHAQALMTNLKRPLIRAVMEMNNCAGTQFDPQWVTIFNKVIQNMQKAGKI